MKELKTSCFLTVLCLLMLLCACSKAASEPERPADSVQLPQLSMQEEVSADDAQAILDYLTSPQLWGRAVGSDGNEAAARAIAGYFSSLGYAPFAEDYCIPYTDHLVRQENANASLALLSADGTRTELTAGTDYIYYPVYAPLDVTLPLTADEDAATDGSAVYCSTDSSARTLAEQNAAAVTFQCVDLSQTITLNNNVETERGAFFQIDTRYSDLLAQDGTRAEIHLDACAEVGEALNVAAIRRGSSGDHALIVSAHFDGSGFYGDVYYPSAYDNASGTTVMLLTARLLAQSDLEADLIFAAFNGEETWLNGSDALAASLCAGYEDVTVINIDCIGLASDDAFTLSGNAINFSALTSILDNYAPCPEEMPSDHMSFYDISNAISTNLADLTAMDYATTLMHTPGDTPDKLSPERLLRAAQLLTSYAEGGVYTTTAAAPDDMICQYEIPYSFRANTNINEAFFAALPRSAGSALDQTYASFDEIAAETGVPLLHPDCEVESPGISLSVWSHDDQPAGASPVYDVSAYYSTNFEGVSVWHECSFSVGEDVDSFTRSYGDTAITVTQSHYFIESLGIEATLYQLDNAAEHTSSIVAFFTADNVFYTCELDASADLVQRYLESFHF